MSKNIKNFDFFEDIWKNYQGMTKHSTSPPCGNLVDGLPHDCHTKTVAKRARVEPRTQMHVTMKMLFQIMFASKKCLLITIIVLDNVLKLWIELIKQRNDNAREKFYLMQAFSKVRNLVEISKISKNLEISKILSKRSLLLYELSEREPG